MCVSLFFGQLQAYSSTLFLYSSILHTKNRYFYTDEIEKGIKIHTQKIKRYWLEYLD